MLLDVNVCEGSENMGINKISGLCYAKFSPWVITSIIKYGKKLFIHSPTAALLKFVKRYAILPDTFLCMWLLIHAVVKLIDVSKTGYRGAVSMQRCRLTSIGIPMLKIRRSRDRLIFNMGIPISGKDGLYIETGPRWQVIAYGIGSEGCIFLCIARGQHLNH